MPQFISNNPSKPPIVIGEVLHYWDGAEYVKYRGVANFPNDSSVNILINGDSTAYWRHSQSWFRQSTPPKNNIQSLGFGDPKQVPHTDMVHAATGLLSYRASDSCFRWRAPGDASYGEWTQILPGTRGWLESSSAGKRMVLGCLDNSDGNANWSDVTVTLTSNGPGNIPNTQIGFNSLQHVFNVLRWTWSEANFHGVPGLAISGLIKSLPYLNQHFTGAGIDITSCAVNDASAQTDFNVSAKLASYRQYIDSRLNAGRTIFWLGIHGYTVGGSSSSWGTAFNAYQYSLAQRLEELFLEYQQDYPNKFFYVNLRTELLDPSYADYRPLISASNYVTDDSIHPSMLGGQRIANKIKSVALASGLISLGPNYNHGDENYFGVQGSQLDSTAAVTVASGMSGTIPASRSVAAISYVNATCAFSVVPRPYGSGSGNAVLMDMASGAGANQGYTLSSHSSGAAPWNASALATAGIVPGDLVRIKLCLDKLVGELSGIRIYAAIMNTTPACNIYQEYSGYSGIFRDVEAFDDSMIISTDWFKLPADFTGATKYLMHFFSVYLKDSTASAKLYVGPLVLEKL